MIFGLYAIFNIRNYDAMNIMVHIFFMYPCLWFLLQRLLVSVTKASRNDISDVIWFGQEDCCVGILVDVLTCREFVGKEDS